MSPNTFLVVGTGPAGSTIARLLAEQNFNVELFDERNHVAGNCFDKTTNHGHLIHYYGPHYFRTNSDELLAWLSRFTDWIPGEYFVQAKINQMEVPLPMGLATMEKLKNKKFSKQDFESYLQSQKIEIQNITNAEEQCLSTVGKELYDLFFKNYTIKQWGLHPRNLESFVTARIPLRFDHDVRYPSEKHQVLPKFGYTEMFKAILDHRNIQLSLNQHITSEWIKQHRTKYQAIIYTGPIDTFFQYCFGKLQYRSLRFEWVHKPDVQYFQSSVQCNYPNDQEYTRIVESKHITKVQGVGTTLCYEYPSSQGEPYYPMPLKLQQEKYQRYLELAKQEEKKDHPMYFLGRLAEYKYYNMDHIFLRAMNVAQEIIHTFKKI